MRRLRLTPIALVVAILSGSAAAVPADDQMDLGSNMPMVAGWSVEKNEIIGGELDPQYRIDMEPFTVVRYMEAQRTNGSTVRSIRDVEVPRQIWFPFPSGNGVPPTWIARQAQLLGVQPWVCVPHLATNALVRHMATTLKGLHPIVEYSNELANTAFEQSRWAASQIGPYSTSAQQRAQALQYGAEKTRQIARIWREIDPDVIIVFTDAPDRWTLRRSTADALSMNAYVGLEASSSGYTEVRGYTADQLIRWLANPSLDRLIARIKRAREGMQKWPLYIYEGGQHVRADVVATSREAQRLPGMGRVYRRLLARLDKIGIDLFVHYNGARNYDATSTFGMIEFTGDWTHKYGAMVEWALGD